MFYRITSLALPPLMKNGPYGQIYITQPDQQREDIAGKVFTLIESEINDNNYRAVIDFIISEIEKNYYNDEKILLKEKIDTIKVEHIFEAALAKTNKNLNEFLRAERINLDPYALNATIGVIHENNIHFTTIGKNRAFLTYKEKAKTQANPKSKNFTADPEEKYKIIDITEKSGQGEDKKQISQTKIFASVISGVMPPASFFIFTNEALPEYLSKNKLMEIITTMAPNSATEQIKTALKQVNNYASFLGIIIKNTINEAIIIEDEKITHSAQQSIDRIQNVETRTERILSPGGYINFKKWSKLGKKLLARAIKSLSKINVNVIKNKVPQLLPHNNFIKDKIFFKKKSSFAAGKKLLESIKNWLSYVARVIFYFFKFITNKNNLISIIDNIKKRTLGLLAWFKHLSRRNKIAIGIIAICVILLAQNIIALSIKNKKVVVANKINELVTVIEQKQNQLDANLIYSNDNATKSLLVEIKHLITQLPANTTAEKKDSIMKKYNEQLEKVSHVVKIDNPTIIADLNKTRSGANPDNLILNLRDKVLYLADINQKGSYYINLTDKSSNIVAAGDDVSSQISALDYPMLNDQGYVYYYDNGAIVSLNAKMNKFFVLPLELPSSSPSIVSSAFFNDRFYLLDKQNNQIYRYSLKNKAIANRVEWLADILDLHDAVSLEIDGSAYVLKANGQIFKYTKGKTVDFKLDAVEPAITDAKLLRIPTDGKYIYVLEPKTKRLIVFNKTGKFIIQYEGDQFSNLKDFAVDESTKTIYLLDNATVYSFTAEALK